MQDLNRHQHEEHAPCNDMWERTTSSLPQDYTSSYLRIPLTVNLQHPAQGWTSVALVRMLGPVSRYTPRRSHLRTSIDKGNSFFFFFQSVFLQRPTLEGSRWWIKYFMFCSEMKGLDHVQTVICCEQLWCEHEGVIFLYSFLSTFLSQYHSFSLYFYILNY